MLCEVCGKNPAAFHVITVVNGEKVEQHLCEECAKQKGGMAFMFHPHLSVAGMLSGLFTPAEGQVEPGTMERCPGCGKTYHDFVKAGRLGCGVCYTQFEKEIEPVMRKIAANPEHVGKVPKRRSGSLLTWREIEGLRRGLDEAVRTENYEEAARLRDQIRELEKRHQESR
ncbi:MAG: UvrB/UvrC motif-containing protein [Bacillota bacterium]|nr:UvrB/UvrC motif-containing protein [Bacillota bacterium]